MKSNTTTDGYYKVITDSMYVCCKCGDGPKLFANQPSCVNCGHIVCEYCIPAD